MSIIKIIIKPTPSIIDVIKSLHNIIGGSIEDLKSALENSIPVFEEEIFTNRYEEHANTLRKIIEEMAKSQFQIDVYEGNFKIDTDALLNILNSSDDIGKEIDCEN